MDEVESEWLHIALLLGHGAYFQGASVSWCLAGGMALVRTAFLPERLGCTQSSGPTGVVCPPNGKEWQAADG